MWILYSFYSYFVKITFLLRDMFFRDFGMQECDFGPHFGSLLASKDDQNDVRKRGRT